jgi:hypothetical protein
MFALMQSRTGRQIFVSTHSPEILQDEGIGLDEVLLLIPDAEGTSVQRASQRADVKKLLEGGLSLAEAVVPQTSPPRLHQLLLWKEEP